MQLFQIHKSSNKYLLDVVKEQFLKNRQKYIKLKNSENFDNNNLNFDNFIEFKKLDDKNQLYDENSFLKLLNSNNKITDAFNKKLTEIQPEIKEWCDKNYLNYDTIKIFFDNYQALIKNVISIDRNNEEYDEGNLKWFQDNMKKYQIYKEDKKINNIIKSFMYSNYSSLFVLDDNYSMTKDALYISVKNNQRHSLDNFFSIKSLTSVKYPGRIIYGYSTHHMTKNIQYISKIELRWLSELFPHIYNTQSLSNNIFKDFEDYQSSKNLRRNMEFYKKLKYYIRSKFKIDYLRNMSVVDKTPVINEYVNEIIKKLK